MCMESLDLPSPAVFDGQNFEDGGRGEECAGSTDPDNTACVDPREIATADSDCAEMLALDEEEQATYAVSGEEGTGLEERNGKRKASQSPSLWGDEGMGRSAKRCKQ